MMTLVNQAVGVTAKHHHNYVGADSKKDCSNQYNIMQRWQCDGSGNSISIKLNDWLPTDIASQGVCPVDTFGQHAYVVC